MRRSIRFALGGLEAGVTGALAMLIWLGLASILLRRNIWWIPNLFAIPFTGRTAFFYGATRYTGAGVALEIFVYGALGCLFGLLWRDHRGGARLLWTGLAVGLAAWYLLFRVAWRAMDASSSLYTPDRQLLIGNIIYGLMLTRYPRYAASVQDAGTQR